MEDKSVDLHLSVLPNGFEGANATHYRLYQDCTCVDHFNIYDHSPVRDLIVQYIRELS